MVRTFKRLPTVIWLCGEVSYESKMLSKKRSSIMFVQVRRFYGLILRLEITHWRTNFWIFTDMHRIIKLKSYIRMITFFKVQFLEGIYQTSRKFNIFLGIIIYRRRELIEGFGHAHWMAPFQWLLWDPSFFLTLFMLILHSYVILWVIRGVRCLIIGV